MKLEIWLLGDFFDANSISGMNFSKPDGLRVIGTASLSAADVAS